jgi:hypothetical protein
MRQINQTTNLIAIFRGKSLNDSAVWRANARGVLIDIGKYPNAIFSYHKFVNELRDVFQIKQEYLSKARATLEALKSNSKFKLTIYIKSQRTLI